MLIFGQDASFPWKIVKCVPKTVFQVFSENIAFFEKIVEQKSIQHLISDKKRLYSFLVYDDPWQLHSDPAAMCKQNIFRSEISLFWRTSCARVFFVVAVVVN